MASSLKARWVLAAGTVAALCAAGAAAYLGYVRPETFGLGQTGGDRPELRELIAALARESTRPIEGRLSGNVPYRPLMPPTRGGRTELSPDVRIAAATVEKRARAATTPANNAALAAALLTIGDWDGAVDAIQEAIEAEPSNPTFHNDASVVYLSRAVHRAFPEDWVRGLAAANRAIRLDARRPEPRFNRALALSGLHLTTDEIEAWSSYVSVDQSSPWREESARRLASLRERQRERASLDRSRDTQILRERIEDELLAQWGSAIERNDSRDADRLLAEAEALAARLVDVGGDAMPRDEVGRIRRARQSDVVRLRALATGHRLFGEARALYVQDRQLDASERMARAAEFLRRGESPYWQWAPVFRAIVIRNSGGDYPAALKALAEVPVSRVPNEYHYLRGRLAWTEGLLRQNRGRFDLTRDLMVRAVDEFRAGGETDYLVATQTILAESEWFLGDWDSAWTNLMDAFAAIDRRGTTRRIAHFDLAATLSSAEGLHESAVEFLTAELRVSSAPRVRAETYLRRARAYAILRDTDAATRDFKAALTALGTVVDPVLNERIAADINVARADFYSGVDCERAVEFTEAALPYLTRTRTIWLGRALGIRARCRESMGDMAGAQADFRAAAELFESRRAGIPSSVDRALAFDLERTAFKDLVAFESFRLRDDAAAFATAERGRAGVLAESWEHSSDQFAPASLAADVAVVYYESLPDRVLAWVITREGRQSFSRPISDTMLRRSTARLQRVIRLGANLVELRAESATLFDSLIAPALNLADNRSAVPKNTVVFIPDGPLFSLPFAALPDAQGRPLLDTRVVSVAPSLRTFLAASTRLASFTPSDVLAVGDGHDRASSGLPMLPRADAEAVEVGKLYSKSTVLTGADATKQRFLAAPAHVIHFAGHAVLNERYPMLSRMLLGPDRAARDSGWLFANEIVASRFDRTDVVVLATCQGAAGRPVAGEGPMSLARAFFAAGVPAVVASLWPVDDDVQTLVHTFHRTLLTTRDPAVALREGQRALLAERGLRTPVRVWGGFVSLGGRLLSGPPSGGR
jgi:CHAT domain-containing protein/tetratricopeptide (TPR) repeat protein